MDRADAAWLGFWVGFAALDLVADHCGRSLCTSVRHVFRTDTPGGDLALDVALASGYLVLRRHLRKR